MFSFLEDFSCLRGCGYRLTGGTFELSVQDVVLDKSIAVPIGSLRRYTDWLIPATAEHKISEFRCGIDL